MEERGNPKTGDVRDDQPTLDGAVLPFTPGNKVAGRYRIEERLGRGAFGEVYRAYDELLGRFIALKAVKLERAGGEGEKRLETALEEARTIAKLDHAGIVPVYDVGIEAGKVWMAMRLVQGEGLHTVLQREGKPRTDRALQLLLQAARALDHAHRKGVIHRDVKPSNILVEKREDGSEQVWLADFGIADVLAEGNRAQERHIAGTPSYMSPEQITGRRVDARTDIFALGCVAYELLTGTRAFKGSTYSEVLHNVVHEQPEDLNRLGSAVGKGLEAMIRRALAKSPEDRYATVEEMARELERLARGEVVRRPLGAAWFRPFRREESARWDGSQALVVRGLSKAYHFRKMVLDGVNLEVKTGSIYALLGRNGSGKTTFIRTVLGIYRKDAGEVLIFGRDPNSHGPAILSRVGYVPETLAAYESITVGQLIEFLRPFYRTWDNAICYNLLSRYELPLDVKLRDLSKGMKTKVSLIAALAHRPEFLLLDDPTIGLDAVTLEEVFETLHEASTREGTTVLISSHNIDEVEKIATHVGLLKEGRMLLSDTVAGLRTRTREVRMTFRDEVPDLRDIRHFRTVKSSGRRVTGVVLDTSSGAMEKLKALGPTEMEVRELSLKEIFVNFLR